MARGLAQKRFSVRPRRFLGEPLAVPAEVAVPGTDTPIAIELYLDRGAERPAIQVACAGKIVCDDIAELAALGLTEPPWTGGGLSGLIDFPSSTYRPGRGAASFPMKLPAPSSPRSTDWHRP
jgi:hypothetical protein